jgi:hypothetical protein
LDRDRAGTCRKFVEEMESIPRDVTTILYPGSARADLTANNIARIVREQGASLWANSKRAFSLAAPAR